ncbi:MAG: DinB family protein [Acidobacteriota bacterium]
MSETHRINSQLKRAYQGEAWHGPSLRELLEGVTAQQAAAKPIPSAHSIWELVNHIIAWEQIARLRLEGDPVKNPSDEMNFPPVNDTSETAWQAALQSLAIGNQALRDSIRKIDDAKLEEIVPEASYSNYGLLHGVIQHDLYHAGQIALLKKAGSLPK